MIEKETTKRGFRMIVSFFLSIHSLNYTCWISIKLISDPCFFKFCLQRLIEVLCDFFILPYFFSRGSHSLVQFGVTSIISLVSAIALPSASYSARTNSLRCTAFFDDFFDLPGRLSSFAVLNPTMPEQMRDWFQSYISGTDSSPAV